jgi:hypothetical protein
MATTKEIFDRQMAEKRYQNQATNFRNYSEGGTGSPTRKAKYSLSQVFDDSGETVTETNIEEDGSETKVVKKTPSDLLKDQTFLSDDMDLSYKSIATPPEADLTEDERLAKLYQEQRELAGVRDLGVRYGDEPTNVSPFYSMKEGRHLLNHEYYGDEKASQFPSLPAETSIGKSLFGNIVVDQSGSTVENDTGTLAITDQDRADAQTAIIEDYNEQDMLELRDRHPEVYEQVVAGEISMPLRINPHEGKTYTAPGFDGSELHAAEVELATQEKIKEEEKELEKNFDDLPWAGDKGIDLTAVVKEIKETDPKAIEVLNDFASWADTVTDEVAIKEAENYLLSLKNSPSVDRRFRKAMAIGMIAMLFGDDFTTAMNTGFGVVADDYTAEAEAAKTEAEAAAELAKTIAKEGRANAENDRRKMRDFTLEMAKTRAELGVKAAEDLEAEIKARAGNNQDYISKEASHYESILTDDQKKTLGVFNFGAQYDRALQFVKKAQPDVVWDLKNNNDQRVAFDTQFQKWLSDKLNGNNFGQGVPAFANYMQDAFIKTQLEGESILNMKDTNPSLYDLQQMGIDTDKIDFGAGMEATNAAYTKIEDYSTGFNERGTLALMAKDYYDWQKSDPDAHKDMVRRANEQGIGGFIWYVTRHVEPTDTIGTKYDPLAVGKDNEWRSDFAIQYLRKEGIIVTPTK